MGVYQTLEATHQSPRVQTETKRERGRARQKRWEYVTLQLPVAATTIVRSSLYGSWRAEAYLDGSTRIGCKPQRFRIEP